MRNFMGLSVMHMSAQGDRPNLLVYFKEKFNMDITDCDYAGNTPLHWACYTTAENALNFLLCWMTNVNVQDKKGQTPLFVTNIRLPLPVPVFALISPSQSTSKLPFTLNAN